MDVVLRYGRILKQYNMSGKSYDMDTQEQGNLTVRIIKYQDKIYYHRMLNGEVKEVVELS